MEKRPDYSTGSSASFTKKTLTDALIEWGGGIEAFGRNSKYGQWLREGGVQKSPEWRRIDRLPRRDWATLPELEQLRLMLTAWLRPPGYVDPEEPITLRPIQAAALRDIHDCRGALMPAKVSAGKTYISILAASVVPCERPIVVVRTRLVKRTWKAIEAAKQHFRIHPNLNVVAYEFLSQLKNENFFFDYRPDLIVCDEAHRFKVGTARTKRLLAYLKKNPDVIYAPMSGTFMSKSIKDFAHHSKAALRDLSPVPNTPETLQEWADATDYLKPNEELRRIEPGALLDWAKDTETPREALRRRVLETPGVVGLYAADDVNTDLLITAWGVPLPKECREAMNNLVDNWITPNGDFCREASEVWRHAREIACGFVYWWNPQAPIPWLTARRDINVLIRNALKRGSYLGTRCDSPLTVMNACKNAAKPPEEYIKWIAIKDTFKPNTEALWLSTSVLEAAAAWLHKYKGICWVEHTETQVKLAELAGVPLYGAGVDGIEEATGPIVASIAAQSESNNLQHYKDALILTPPPGAKTWEQVLARLHRTGQTEDVTYHVNLSCQPLIDSFLNARSNAYVLTESLGPQKLILADLALDTQLDLSL